MKEKLLWLLNLSWEFYKELIVYFFTAFFIGMIIIGGEFRVKLNVKEAIGAIKDIIRHFH